MYAATIINLLAAGFNLTVYYRTKSGVALTCTAISLLVALAYMP